LTVFAVGSNGGIFSTSEKTLSSVGIISNPAGAFSEDLTFPVIAIEECAFSEDIFWHTVNTLKITSISYRDSKFFSYSSKTIS